MLKVLKRCLLCSLVLFAVIGCGSEKKKSNNTATLDSVTAGFKPKISLSEQKKYHTLVENFLQANLLKGSFNGSILVAKEGVPVYEEYIGYKNIKTKDTLTAETPMQISSTSKPFTAAAILRLVQEGKMNLDDPILKFFPLFPYEAITVKTLLNHRSGLPNYLYFMEDGGWNRTTLASNPDVLSTLMSWQPSRAYRPNSNFNYSNTNYVLLALIVEKVTGLTFPQYMKSTFFDPLLMQHTYVLTLNDSSKLTPSYDGYGKEWPLDFSDGPYGDKNIYSTPRDLLKWDQAWYEGAVINQQLADSTFTSYSNERPGTHNYGLGWRLLNIPNGKTVIYHNGRWHGFNSAFARLTDEKVTIIILSNKFNREVYFAARKMYNIFGNYGGAEPPAE
jgi:CubicO group peptidase (beta-lactamase class C family)